MRVPVIPHVSWNHLDVCKTQDDDASSCSIDCSIDCSPSKTKGCSQPICSHNVGCLVNRLTKVIFLASAKYEKYGGFVRCTFVIGYGLSCLEELTSLPTPSSQSSACCTMPQCSSIPVKASRVLSLLRVYSLPQPISSRGRGLCVILNMLFLQVTAFRPLPSPA